MDWTHRIAGLALATLLPAVAGASTPKGMVEVREEVLDNGLKVLLLENHRSPAVTFQVWYRVGSRNEVDGKSGMAHFLEHMLFKGTDKVAPEEYARIIKKHGGRSNAFTSHDATVYHATMSRETIGIAVELEADRHGEHPLRGKVLHAREEGGSGGTAHAPWTAPAPRWPRSPPR